MSELVPDEEVMGIEACGCSNYEWPDLLSSPR